jgi:hypothetical protein
VAAIAAATLLLAPTCARAQITFGANLNRPVNTGFDCTVSPSSAGGILFPTNGGSGTWAAVGIFEGVAATTESFLVPSGVGTIVQVRVRVGQITGPMQVVALRSIRALGPDPGGTPPPGSLTCCFEVARSAVFTPAANAVTTVATNLPVKSDVVPNPITNAVEFDTLGLSVLAPGVPVPLNDTGGYATHINSPGAAVFFPAMGPGEERFAGISGLFGYQVLMDATWVPGQAVGGGGGGGGGGAAGAAVTLVQPVASRQRNFLSLGLRCNQATPCVGALQVLNGAQASGNAVALAATVAARGGIQAAAKKPKGPVVVAKAQFNVPAGASLDVRAKITAKGKKIVKKRKPMYVTVTMNGTATSVGGITVAP